jgi:hypothetical protein
MLLVVHALMRGKAVCSPTCEDQSDCVHTLVKRMRRGLAMDNGACTTMVSARLPTHTILSRSPLLHTPGMCTPPR